MSIRTERVSSFIQQDIAALFEREFRGSSVGFITVTGVDVTPDLKTARIYVSILGNDELREKTMQSLDGQKKHIRQILGSHLRMKFTPSIEFFLDETQERVSRIESLLKKIHDEDAIKP